MHRVSFHHSAHRKSSFRCAGTYLICPTIDEHTKDRAGEKDRRTVGIAREGFIWVRNAAYHIMHRHRKTVAAEIWFCIHHHSVLEWRDYMFWIQLEGLLKRFQSLTVCKRQLCLP